MVKAHPVPREHQAEILKYTGGRMGVAAVPGSGKTWTLSLLAAKLVREGNLKRGQQVLVVTLVNAARGKFEQQVRDFLDEGDLGTFYRVRTLHGLANDIVSERPGLVGLADDFQILDDFLTGEIVKEAVEAWFKAHRDFGMAEYLSEEARKNERARGPWHFEASEIALDFIKQAKDLRKVPHDLRVALSACTEAVPLAEMCVSVYEAYDRSLRYRGAVDFQDLIRLALDALEADSELLDRLRHRWPYILEDEAQDSSQLQEAILRELVGKTGHWVRVGDPNQAIFETFTTANPKFLRDFLNEPDVTDKILPVSGRSAPAIIEAANHLIEWSLEHPIEEIRERRPLTRPLIEPLPEGNPLNIPTSVQLFAEKTMTPDEERIFVADSLKVWLERNPDKTVAILLPSNRAGATMANVLGERKIKFVELLKAKTATRLVAASLHKVLHCLASPDGSSALSEAFVAWRHSENIDTQTGATSALLRRLATIEQFTAPRDRDWLLETVSRTASPVQYEQLDQFRSLLQRWQKATALPVDELVLTVANDIFKEPAEIATAYSIALKLRGFADLHPESGLSDCVKELEEIANNKRKIEGLSDDDEQFDPSRYKGQAVIMTNHGAKGLEWDRVYLMSVSNYDFPSADPFDSFIGEKWFVRSQLNLRAEGLAQLKAITSGESYREGNATREARIEYAAERLRLLYVGITRARSELIVTWNTGDKERMVAAKPLPALSVLLRTKPDSPQS